jgi:hypothetical protein
LDIEPGCKTLIEGTTNMDWKLAVMAVDGRTNRDLADRAKLTPA